jgi:hypothetical protein
VRTATVSVPSFEVRAPSNASASLVAGLLGESRGNPALRPHQGRGKLCAHCTGRLGDLGRAPITVTNWWISFGEATLTLPHGAGNPAIRNPPLPHVLGSGEQASWVMELAEVFAAAPGIETLGPITEMRANVRVTGGRICSSDAHTPDSDGCDRMLHKPPAA